MEGKMQDKIREVRDLLDDLQSFLPHTYDLYAISKKDRYVCEHCAERIIEACVDIAFMVSKAKKLPIPQDDLHVFRLLSSHNILSEILAKELIKAKGMRNIIAHEYGRIDDTIVYTSLKEKLSGDVEEFLRRIENTMI